MGTIQALDRQNIRKIKLGKGNQPLYFVANGELCAILCKIPTYNISRRSPQRIFRITAPARRMQNSFGKIRGGYFYIPLRYFAPQHFVQNDAYGVAVSYTHLDVYKRQAFGSSLLPGCRLINSFIF